MYLDCPTYKLKLESKTEEDVENYVEPRYTGECMIAGVGKVSILDVYR